MPMQHISLKKVVRNALKELHLFSSYKGFGDTFLYNLETQVDVLNNSNTAAE